MLPSINAMRHHPATGSHTASAHKSDAVLGTDALAVYEVQLHAYARAIEDASTEQVVRSVLLFLHPTGALEHVITKRPVGHRPDLFDL
ncbi:hypothetical protein Lesp01_86380 [Lentzea sp. NBRC 102530]|nr:hypothetical protein Lesp01_86380 [Lentzea sp. NBRC 102530]